MFKPQYQTLTNLAISALISEGEFDVFCNEDTLVFPLKQRKFSYLENIIKENELSANITINPKREQVTIYNHPPLGELRKEWYEKGNKIFSKTLDHTKINLESIVLCINLFGERKTETITIPTSIDTSYINILSYCIEHYLGVPVIPAINHVKLTRIPYTVLSLIPKVAALHSAELVNMLTAGEKRKYMKGVSR